MDARPKATDKGPEPDPAAGAVVGFLGGWAAVGGIIFLLFQYDYAEAKDLVVGGVLVIGGLLLRIESAIRGTGGRRRS